MDLEERRALGSKLLSNVDLCFRRDPLIDDYDFIVRSDDNQNPVILVDHKLGIETWAVEVLVQHAYTNLLAVRNKHNSPSPPDGQKLVSWTRAVLLAVADCSTAWNVRKELVLLGRLSWQQDLKLTNLILAKHNKSSETFAHKKWLLSRCFAASVGAKTNTCLPQEDKSLPHHSVTHNDMSLPQDVSLTEVLGSELKCCQIAADRYPNNYNAWTHRIWLLTHLAPQDSQLISDELASSLSFVSSHVSDHSGWHYRQVLISLTRPPSLARSLLQRELDLTSDLIITYPGHEAVWCHRRYIVSRLIQDGCCTDLVQRELEFAEGIETKSAGQWQAKLAANYCRWLHLKFT